MFNFIPRFGRRLESSEDWCSVPLSLLPAGYKLERRIVGGKRFYRLCLPNGTSRPVRGPEHARLLAGAAVQESNDVRYSQALIGFVRNEHEELLVFIFADGEDDVIYGAYEEVEDLLEEIADELDENVDFIDTMSEDNRGLVYDLNAVDPWSFFDELGEVDEQRLEQIADVAELVGT